MKISLRRKEKRYAHVLQEGVALCGEQDLGHVIISEPGEVLPAEALAFPVCPRCHQDLYSKFLDLLDYKDEIAARMQVAEAAAPGFPGRLVMVEHMGPTHGENTLRATYLLEG